MKTDGETRKKVYRREHFACALCGNVEGLQVHHIIHRSQGGANAPHNLIALCWRCHAIAHGTRFPELDMTERDMEQEIDEYMADLYACMGLLWNPWAKRLDRIAEVPEGSPDEDW